MFAPVKSASVFHLHVVSNDISPTHHTNQKTFVIIYIFLSKTFLKLSLAVIRVRNAPTCPQREREKPLQMNKKLICATPIAIAAALSLYACGGSEIGDPDITAIKNVVVIYAENRSFDNLYGNFPGANGLQNVTRGQLHPGGSRRLAARDAAASVERPDANRRDAGRHAGDDSESAEQPVCNRRPERFQHADHRHDARSVSPFLREPDADQRRQERQVRRVGGFGRPRDGPLFARRRQAAAVEDRAAIHARRQLLHGRVRRLVPESPVADLRLHAGLSECGQEPGRRVDLVGGKRRRDAEARVELAGFGADGRPEVRAVGQPDA